MNKVKYFLLLIAICYSHISAFTQNKIVSDNVQNDSLLKSAKSYPVAPFNDTLFFIRTKIGSFSAKDRAIAINQRIKNLYKDDF